MASDVLTTRFELPTKDYSPKFKSREEICGFYFAGTCRGASADIIARATGMNVNTVRKLLSRNAKKYIGIKREFAEKGEDEFGKLYYTEGIAKRLIRAQSTLRR